MVAGVYEEGVGEGFDVDPLAAVLDVEAVDAVLVEEREQAVVGVRRKADDELRAWAGRVQVGDEDLEA